MERSDNIERLIIIGLITSTEYISTIRDLYSSQYLESESAKRLATWCNTYFDQYGKAPGGNIESIYYEKLSNGLQKEIGQDIEEILLSLSDEYTEEEKNTDHLIDLTIDYFNKQKVKINCSKALNFIEANKFDEAKKLLENYQPLSIETEEDVDFSQHSSLREVDAAFEESGEILIRWPKQLGTFWNHSFTKGSFVAILSPEKRGKTWMLMKAAELAVDQGRKVAFFQAGDMTKRQQIRRFCISLAKKSDKEKYCGVIWEPVRDCVYNQLDTCDKKERECNSGVFETLNLSQVRGEITIDQLKEAYNDNPNYKPCFNCVNHKTEPIGAVWLKKIDVGDPLDKLEAKKLWKRHFIDGSKNIRLSTHANGTLTVNKMRNKLKYWKKKFNFEPEVILIDYMDLLEDSSINDYRQKQNKIWKEVRGMSQENNQPLIIAPTQADAKSYEIDTLKQSNFSEDKRKYAHVTAFYGLNQDHLGREKRIGIMRINELILREDEFDSEKCVYVLQNLKRGQPVIASYF